MNVADFTELFTFTSITSPSVLIILALIFGTAIGSFLNVLIWRLPREESIQGRSYCPHCNHKLRWIDLIPLFSILLQRGRCRYCQKPVSFRYPTIEIVTGVLFALAMWYFPIVDVFSGLLYFKIVSVIAICIVVFVVDLEHFLILDRVVYPGIILMLLFAASLTLLTSGFNFQILTTSFLAAAAAFIPFWLLWFLSKGKWMGYGDVKFAAFMGFALGLKGVIMALFISFMLGAIVGVLLVAFGKKQWSSRLPFGTFLSLATVISLFLGNQLWNWYWSLFTIV